MSLFHGADGAVTLMFDKDKWTRNEQGTTIFVIEQNVNMALSIAHRGYVLQTGRVVLSGPAAELLRHEDLRKAYLGR